MPVIPQRSWILKWNNKIKLSDNRSIIWGTGTALLWEKIIVSKFILWEKKKAKIEWAKNTI